MAATDRLVTPERAEEDSLEASLRPKRLSEFVGGVYRRLRSRFVELARTAQRSGELSAAADAEAIGAALFALFPGYGLQQLLTGSPGPEEFKAGLRALLGAVPRSGV